MSRATVVLLVIMFVLTIGLYWASRRGWGAAQPDTQPISIREGSVHQATGNRGHSGTRYFLLGGGIRSGK